jgi:predicted nuclease of restriction endonuclease-like (RecB) superfamily
MLTENIFFHGKYKQIMKNIQTSSEYAALLNQLKERIRSAQYEALRAVNKELISLYWDIGKIIINRQNKLGWGKSIVEKLSADLQHEFPGMSGFSPRNIWYMRNLFVLYNKNKKLQPLVAEIAWTHLAS